MIHSKRLFLIWCCVVFTGAYIAPPVSAREKTDIVILKNGDRITCEVKSLSRGMLTVKTDSMGTVDIKWPDVDKITTKYLFTVQDTTGQIYVGSLRAATDNGRVKVEGPAPAENLEHLAVVQMQELGGSRWKRFSGSVDSGSSFSKASGIRQFNFAGDVVYRTERYSAELNYSSTLGSTDGERTANRQFVSIAGTRYFTGKWLAYSQASYEHNIELQLDRRGSFLAGPGYRIVQSNRALVTAIGAGSFTRESYYGQDLVYNAEGYIGISAQFFKLYSPKYDLTNQFAYMPNFTTLGRRRLEFNSKMRVEVLKDFFITLTFYDSYDSKPPSEGATKNDYGFTTGISWSFRK